jgi:hypothetical protein
MLSGFAEVLFSTLGDGVNAFVWQQDGFTVERGFYGEL